MTPPRQPVPTAVHRAALQTIRRAREAGVPVEVVRDMTRHKQSRESAAGDA